MRMVIAREFPGVQVVNARTNDAETRVEAVDSTMRRLVNGEPAIIIPSAAKFSDLRASTSTAIVTEDRRRGALH